MLMLRWRTYPPAVLLRPLAFGPATAKTLNRKRLEISGRRMGDHGRPRAIFGKVAAFYLETRGYGSSLQFGGDTASRKIGRVTRVISPRVLVHGTYSFKLL